MATFFANLDRLSNSDLRKLQFCAIKLSTSLITIFHNILVVQYGFIVTEIENIFNCCLNYASF
jgi:hypothetical protein